MITPQLPSGTQAAELTRRVDRYCRHLDHALEHRASPQDRMALLRAESAFWEKARADFFRMVDVDDLDPPPDGPDATEYLLIIGAIDERILREG